MGTSETINEERVIINNVRPKQFLKSFSQNWLSCRLKPVSWFSQNLSPTDYHVFYIWNMFTAGGIFTIMEEVKAKRAVVKFLVAWEINFYSYGFNRFVLIFFNKEPGRCLHKTINFFLQACLRMWILRFHRFWFGYHSIHILTARELLHLH